jgi:Platelet-activating factor acetylhydrolase, isoform II
MWPAVPLKDALDLTFLSDPDPNHTVQQEIILNPIPAPYLVAHTEYFQWPANMRQERSLVRNQNRAIHLRVTEAGHNNFSDTGFLSPYIQGRLMKKTGMQDPLALQEMINDLLATFLSDCDSPDTPRSISSPIPGEGNGFSFGKTLAFAHATKHLDILEARW